MQLWNWFSSNMVACTYCPWKSFITALNACVTITVIIPFAEAPKCEQWPNYADFTKSRSQILSCPSKIVKFVKNLHACKRKKIAIGNGTFSYFVCFVLKIHNHTWVGLIQKYNFFMYFFPMTLWFKKWSVTECDFSFKSIDMKSGGGSHFERLRLWPHPL